MSTIQHAPPAGWYPDPTGCAPLRYWSGRDWSAWTSDGTTMTEDPPGGRRPLDLSDMGHLDFVDLVFLSEARARGYLTASADTLLTGLLSQMRVEALGVAAPEGIPVGGRPDTVASGAGVASTPRAVVERWTTLENAFEGTSEAAPRATEPALEGRPMRQPAVAAPRKTPSPRALWWARTRDSVASDLAVHGLAYLGVLLFFVGAFGLVAFAFGDVAPALRPGAEAVIALAPFAAGALLRRRGATVVGRALEMAGGLLLPVMVITTFLDGVAFPPDLTGAALAVTVTLLTALVAVGYAVWSARHPDSALRYLVAPVGWLAVAMATLGVGREMPAGRGVATPSSAQCAAMLGALLATAAWARLRPRARLAAPTTAVTLPGLAVIGALSVLSWMAEGWPGTPVLVSGVLVVVALELSASRLSAAVVGVVEPLWWVFVVVGLVESAAVDEAAMAALAAVAAAGFVAILETAASAHRPGLTVALPAAGAVVALAGTWADPRWAAASLAVAAIWASLRRVTPFEVPGAAVALDLSAALLPVAALAALASATNVPTASLTGGAVVLLAAVVARGKVLDRSPVDPFWRGWWAGGTVLVAGVALSAWQDHQALTVNEQWLLAATLALLTLASAISPMEPRLRPLVVTALFAATWVVALGVVAAPVTVVVVPLGVLAVGEVIAAHADPRQLRDIPKASLGLTGHLLGAATIVMALSSAWAVAVTTGLATVGWVWTGWLDSKERSVVGAMLGHVHPAVRWLPLGAAAAGIPVSVALVLDASGVLHLTDPWSEYVLVAGAIAYAALTRFRVPDRVGASAAWAAFASGVTASMLAREPLPAVTLAALPAAVTLMSPTRRHPVMTWTAWLSLTPIAAVLALDYSSWFAALPWRSATSVCLVAVGSVLVVGGAAVDLRGRSFEPHLLPVHPGLRPPVLLGSAHVVVGLVVAASGPGDRVAGWTLVGAAIAVLITAVLSRAGLLAGLAVLLGWTAVGILEAPTIESQPWIAVVASLALLLAAEAASRLSGHGGWWSRWDLPLLVASAPVALTALVVAGDGPSAALTFTVVGLEVLAVAARLRRRIGAAVPLGVIGATLVIWGAGLAGTGWLSLALLGLSAALTGLAVRVRDGAPKVVLQVTGAAAALAAWQSGSDWLSLSDQRAVEIAAVGAGLLALAAAVTARFQWLGRSWVLAWGGAAVFVEALCAFAALAGEGVFRTDVVPTWTLAAGPALVAGALAGVATAVGIGWLRGLSVLFALDSLQVGLLAVDASTTDQVVVLSAVSVATATVLLALRGQRSAYSWRLPLVVLGAVTTVWAFAVAIWSPSAPSLVAPVLAVAAIQAAACGVALHRLLLQMAAPVLALSAWLVFGSEALSGDPQWVTVPVGLSLLVIVALWRHDRAAQGRPVASKAIVVLELVGIGFLVGSALVQTVTVTLVYAAVSTVIGVAVMVWGALTRVRRRVAAGAAAVAVSLGLLVGLPLVDLLPSWEGAGLWVLIGGVGLLAVLFASMLERGKAAMRKGMTLLSEATAGWE